jgi:nicotinamide phosphoribosyltransferase
MLSSGLGHASSFRGSDSIIVIPGARYFYDEPDNEVAINSVNASEHSVSTTKIFTCGEQQMIADWLVDFPKGILSIVSDTFDLWKLITEYLPANKEAIMARDGKLVIRPDSGDPVDIICGTDKPIVSEYSSYVTGYTNGKLIRKARTVKEVISNFKDESPKLYEIAIRIANKEVNVEDGIYSSQITDNQQGVYNYFEVKNSEIVSIGEERIREGGWYWFSGEKDIYENIPVIKNIKTPDKHKTSAQKGVIELLWDIFGGTINEQGYKVLDPHIGAIYGDSITIDRQVQIYERLAAKGFASTNIVLGVGSYTYQMNTRDTLGFAAKGAWFEVEERNQDDLFDQGGPKIGDMIKVGYDIFKDPVTDNGTKKSLKGRCAVHLVDGEYVVKTQCTEQEEKEGLLHTIYEDGKFYNQTTLTEIRKRIDSLV